MTGQVHFLPDHQLVDGLPGCQHQQTVAAQKRVHVPQVRLLQVVADEVILMGNCGFKIAITI